MPAIGKINVDAMKIIQKKIDVAKNNITNLDTPNYCKQEVDIAAKGSLSIGNLQFGQGCEITNIHRVYDPMLEEKLLSVLSQSAGKMQQMQCLSWLEEIHNDTEQNISQKLTAFFNSFKELSDALPSNDLAARTNVKNAAENLAKEIKMSSVSLNTCTENLERAITLQLEEVNNIAKELAGLNKEIFENEAGSKCQANDLRDRRNGVLQKLAEKIEITTQENNGKFSVYVGNYPLVSHNYAEQIIAKSSSEDRSETSLYWYSGDAFCASKTGQLPMLLNLRKNNFANNRAQLDGFANDLITSVNSIYANGCEKQGLPTLTSYLGYSAFGVSSTTAPLNIVEQNKQGHIEIAFYNENKEIVRSAGIIVEANDSLSSIASKLNAIPGLQSATIFSTDKSQDGRLQISVDSNSAANKLGEKTFGIASPASVYNSEEGNYTTSFQRDTSGVLELFGFKLEEKSNNASNAAPVLQSKSLTALQNDFNRLINPIENPESLGLLSVADMRTAKMNKSGFFTIDCFETANEIGAKTNGQHLQQFRIPVNPSDSIEAIATKVSDLYTSYGIKMTFNALSECYEITSDAMTDAKGNLVSLNSPASVNNVRLSFGYIYNEKEQANDIPPAGFNGLGDNTGLFATMQMNTLFVGDSAGDITVDPRITLPNQIHRGYSLEQGNNGMAIDLFKLSQKKAALQNTCTLEESYNRIVAKVGFEVQNAQTQHQGLASKLKETKEQQQKASGLDRDTLIAEMMDLVKQYELNAQVRAMQDKLDDITLHLI